MTSPSNSSPDRFRPMIPTAIGIMLGSALGLTVDSPLHPIVLLCTWACIPLPILLRRLPDSIVGQTRGRSNPIPTILMLSLIALSVGLTRTQLRSRHENADIRRFVEQIAEHGRGRRRQPCLVEGRCVRGVREFRDDFQVVIEVEHITCNAEPLTPPNPFRIRVNVPHHHDRPLPGDRVSARLSLREPRDPDHFTDFDERSA